MISAAELIRGRRAAEADDQPTALIPSVAVPAPAVGPAPADDDHRDDDGHPADRHRGHKRSARHPQYGWRLVDNPAPADYSPMHPADRQILAPTHWADRVLPAGPAERTGVLHLDDIQHARQTETTAAL